jgi:hypothetical protein
MNSSRSSASSHALKAASAISASRTTFVFSVVVVVVRGALRLHGHLVDPFLSKVHVLDSVSYLRPIHVFEWYDSV